MSWAGPVYCLSISRHIIFKSKYYKDQLCDNMTAEPRPG